MRNARSYPKPLQSVLSKVDEVSKGQDTDLRSVIEAFGDRAFGPVLVMCGVILLTPVGAVPGVPLFVFAILTIFALQIITGRKHPWLPNSASRVTLKHTHLIKIKQYLKPVLSRIDGLLRPRWPWAAERSMLTYAAVITLTLAASVLLLGAIPFAAMLPGTIIIILGLGITARDGVFIVAGLGMGTACLLLLTNLILKASGFTILN